MHDNLTAEIRFSIIPEWITYADISDKAIRLYSVLARYADNQTHQAFPSRDTLAGHMHCSAKSVDRATEELILLIEKPVKGLHITPICPAIPYDWK